MQRADANDGDDSSRELLADHALRARLVRYMRKRVANEDVDDLVQTVLCAAVASSTTPSEPASLTRWVMAIARHKVADHFRREGRDDLVPVAEAVPSDDAAWEWMLWAEQQVQGDDDAGRTLRWMAREGRGEKLAHIAADERLPSARVRKRVSRLRDVMRRRWAAELAVLLTLAAVALLAWQLLQPDEPRAELLRLAPHLPEPIDTSLVHAKRLRLDAVKACDDGLWHQCLELLDRAARLDLAGGEADDAKLTRARAIQALEWERVQREIERRRNLRPTPDVGP